MKYHVIRLASPAILLISFVSTLMAAEISTKEAYSALISHPTANVLRDFKNTCKTPIESFDFDSDSDLIATLKPHQSDAVIQAWVYSVLHCADGASAESLLSQLNDIYLENPRSVIHEISLEKMTKTDVARLTDYENPDQPFANCADARTYYQKRIDAVKAAAIPAGEEAAREKLIEGLSSARKDCSKLVTQ